jgi:uncharacterized DUF497 family protein
MELTWDEAKRGENLAKHKLDLADAEAVFGGAFFTFVDDRFHYREQRFITIGMLRNTVVVVAHTEQDDRIRVMSMRKATANEPRLYFRGFADGLGTDRGDG